MPDQRISPHYGYEKYDSGSLDDLIAVFQDRLRYWLLEPAKALLEFPFGDLAALHLLLGFFEPHSIYLKGQDSKDQSQRFFCDGFVEVFRATGIPESVSRRVAEVLYKEARCGLFHEGMLRERIFFGRPGKALWVTFPKIDGEMDTNGEIQSIVIDARQLCFEIERYASEYVASLRDTTNTALRENFKKAVDLRWRIGERPQPIGMTEEEWERMCGGQFGGQRSKKP
jgi:hypothetical protein